MNIIPYYPTIDDLELSDDAKATIDALREMRYDALLNGLTPYPHLLTVENADALDAGYWSACGIAGQEAAFRRVSDLIFGWWLDALDSRTHQESEWESLTDFVCRWQGRPELQTANVQARITEIIAAARWGGKERKAAA